MSSPTSSVVLPVHAKSRERGAALLVAMIMLLLLMLLAVVGMRTVTLESRIAGNMLQSQRLQETADGALREGERVIQKYGLALVQCPTGVTVPVSGSKPCYISEAQKDPVGLDSTYSVSAKATGFEKPYGYWYPRYIDTVHPKGKSSTAALELCTTGCTEFYELNSQATSAEGGPQDCGPEGLCLRSAINLFIK